MAMRSSSTERIATPPLTEDAVLGGRLKLLQPATGHRAGHDAILLAAAAPKSVNVLELGAGVGTAGLALLARGIASQMTLVEIDAALSVISAENAKRNGVAERVKTICADVTSELPLPQDTFDLVVMNPPFNDETHRPSPDPQRAVAHNAADTTIEDWIATANRHCKAGGSLIIIHRPEATLPILKSLERRFGAIEMIPVFPKPETAAIRLILRAIKGRKTPAKMLPGIILNNSDGSPSAFAERILRDGAALP
jgi:tRNA1(Val) A37 N6-methylase TrmN6